MTEAYAILSDEALRKKYDRLIFGDSADSREFENEDAYQYWSNKKETSRVKEDYEEMQEKIREKLKNFKDYDDFLKNFENHREKNEHRTHLMREEGWKDLNDKYGHGYKFFEDIEGETQHKYNSYGADQYMEGYWDTKINALYYSQPLSTRAWLNIKKVGRFYFDIWPLWLFSFVVLFYNAHTCSKKFNVSRAHDLIFCIDRKNQVI